jgi:hypothetical protein
MNEEDEEEFLKKVNGVSEKVNFTWKNSFTEIFFEYWRLMRKKSLKNGIQYITCWRVNIFKTNWDLNKSQNLNFQVRENMFTSFSERNITGIKANSINIFVAQQLYCFVKLGV